MIKKQLFLITIILLILLLSNNAFSFILSSDNLYNERFEDSMISNNVILDSGKVDIIYPRSTVPIIVEKGRFFTIDFSSEDFEQIFVSISTAYEPIVDEIYLDIVNLWKTNEIWHANVTVPIIIPEKLYNISLIIYQNDTFYSLSRPRSVNVIDELQDNFTFIHLADFHVGDPRGLLESIKETIGWKSVKRCINEVNLLHPDFVIISGDLVFGQLYPFEYSREYKKCYEMIQMFDVPTYLVPGNHDGYRRIFEDGLEIWKEYFGPLFYSFNYGNYHFQAVNSFDWIPLHRLCTSFISLNWGGSIQDEQLDWIQKDLNETDTKLKFMFLHHNPLWDTKKDSLLRMGYNNREELLNLIYENSVDMVLAGHVHVDNVTVENGTIFLTTTTPESEIRTKDGYWGYRKVDIVNGSIYSYNYEEPKYSIPSYKLNVEYDGLYQAKIKNELDEDFKILIKFIVPKRPYTIENAKIEMI